MPRKSMATKVPENMHQAITDNKKRPSSSGLFIYSKAALFSEGFFIENNQNTNTGRNRDIGYVKNRVERT